MQQSTSDTMIKGLLQTVEDRERDVREVREALKGEIQARLAAQRELAVAQATIKNLRGILDDVGFYEDEDGAAEFEPLPEEPLYYDDEEEF